MGDNTTPGGICEGTVLVIDDEPSVVKAVSRLLRSMGYEVRTASGGRDAVELCRSPGVEIDVVLLDLALPELTSMETVRQIRSLRSGIKVILASGYSKQETMESFAGIPFEGFVSKPFGYAELQSTMRAVLSAPTRSLSES